MNDLSKVLIAMTVFVSLSIGHSTFASLGRSEALIDNDQTNLRAHSHVRVSGAKFTSHQLTSQMNTVTEYADSTGTVFAVTWHGVVKPDLETLLGSYFKEYSDSDVQRPRMRTRKPVHVQTANVVVVKEGHMRDVRGRAYLPNRVPPGVNMGDLE